MTVKNYDAIIYALLRTDISATAQDRNKPTRWSIQVHLLEEAVANTLCFETVYRLNIPVSITQGIR